MRLSGQAWFPTPGYEIMAECILQKADQGVGVGPLNWTADTVASG
jgi:hypothetical protein